MMNVLTIMDFDRQLLLALNGSGSLWLDNMAHILTTATTWIPMYLALMYMVIKCNDNMRQIVLVVCAAGLCALLSGSLCDIFVKPTVMRWRPTHDPEIGMLVDVVNGYRGGNYGFFSSHAANTFSIAILFALLVRSVALSGTLVFWSLLNCWTRMYLGVHYPGDILCGLLWGGSVGAGVYLGYVYLNGGNRKTGFRFVSEKYTSSGYLHADTDVVILVFIATLIYATIRSCII